MSHHNRESGVYRVSGSQQFQLLDLIHKATIMAGEQ